MGTEDIDLNIAKLGITMTKFWGLNQEKPKFLMTYLLAHVNLAFCNISLVLNIYGIYMYYDDIEFLPDALQAFVTLVHTINKVISQMVYRSSLYDLLERRKRFWDIKNADSSVRKECLKIASIAKRITKMYAMSVVICGISYMFKPLFFEKSPPPLTCYIPNGCYYFILGFQNYLMFIIPMMTAGFDIIFLGMCIELKIQFRLLCNQIKKMKLGVLDRAEYIKEWRRIAEYHGYLLEYCRKLHVMSTPAIIMQYLATATANSMQLYILVVRKGNSGKMFISAWFCLCSLIELALYCFPAELLSSEASKVADEAFYSGWEDVDIPYIKKLVHFMIFRGQKAVEFGGKGLAVIDLRTFITIFKTTFSFYTFARELAED